MPSRLIPQPGQLGLAPPLATMAALAILLICLIQLAHTLSLIHLSPLDLLPPMSMSTLSTLATLAHFPKGAHSLSMNAFDPFTPLNLIGTKNHPQTVRVIGRNHNRRCAGAACTPCQHHQMQMTGTRSRAGHRIEQR